MLKNKWKRNLGRRRIVLSSDEYFRSKLEKSKLFKESKENAEIMIKQKMREIDNSALKEKIINFYFALINDIDFLLRYDIDRDPQVFIYMKDKIKNELSASHLMLQIQEISSFQQFGGKDLNIDFKNYYESNLQDDIAMEDEST